MPTTQAIESTAAAAGETCLPSASQLAALGTVLCLYRDQPGGELTGWAQAVRAGCADAGDVDSDGLHGRLLFHDRDGRCCWQLHLLPDSDFLAWEQLSSSLPRASAPPAGGLGERLWSRLASRLRGGRWEASVLRLHALRCMPGFGASPSPPMLAASLATPSVLGAAAARRIVRLEGADADALGDDCCCQQAARTAARAAWSNAGSAEELYPLIRLKSRTTA